MTTPYLEWVEHVCYNEFAARFPCGNVSMPDIYVKCGSFPWADGKPAG